MAFDALSQRNKNPYRFMIITGDENIIEQIQNNKNLHLMKSVLVEDEEEELSPPPVINKYLKLFCLNKILNHTYLFHRMNTRKLKNE